MKVGIEDLKRAVDWIRLHSPDMKVDVQMHQGQLFIKCMDKYKVGVEIKLYEDSTMMPKIIKEDILP